MNTNRISTLLRFLGLALLTACINPMHASAQMLRGTFTLPTEVRWGQATLPAGDYTFTMESVNRTCPVVIYQGTNHVAMIYAVAQKESFSGPSQLTVVHGRVHTLSIAELGEVLQYTPKGGEKGLTAPEEREIAQYVPVSTAGK